MHRRPPPKNVGASVFTLFQEPGFMPLCGHENLLNVLSKITQCPAFSLRNNALDNKSIN
jgi:hypothetical protein